MNNNTDNEVEITLDPNEQIALRRKKLQLIRKERQAFPNDFKRKDLAQNILNSHEHKD